MNVEYICLRLARRFIPEFFVRFLLRHNFVIESGSEFNNPQLSAKRYLRELKLMGRDFKGTKVLVLGFGPSFGLAVSLLKSGARRVFLYDKYARLDHKRNFKLFKEYSRYLYKDKNKIWPNPEYITLLRKDISSYNKHRKDIEADIVLSSSVLEHIQAVDETLAVLADCTSRSGIHIHFVDLRDHFFKYPFEMLAYSERIWSKFLNPSSSLNRLRLKDYEFIFNRYFGDVRINIIERYQDSFARNKGRILPQFLSGDDQLDSAGSIVIVATCPKK